MQHTIELHRYELTQTVQYEGYDFWGRPSTLTLEPAPHQDDWVWGIENRDIQITPSIMQVRKRRVVLACEGRVLHGFEHLGILRAAGLRSVRIRSLRKNHWPPFDGCSLGWWNAVMPHVHARGWLTAHEPWTGGDPREARDELDPSRYTRWVPTGEGVLRLGGYIDYPRLGTHGFWLTYPGNDPGTDLLPLARARTLGWPRALRHAARAAQLVRRWPHYEHIIWPRRARGLEVLQEVGLHRMLDMLAILNFAAPADCYLAGNLFSQKGSHRTDVMLLRQITGAAHNVVPLRRKVA